MQSISNVKKEKLKEMCWLSWTECSDFNSSMDNGRANTADMVPEQKHADQ